MSLDVYLNLEGHKSRWIGSGIFIREDGANKQISREEWDSRFPDREPAILTPQLNEEDEDDLVYTANITHNLTRMADEAGLYDAVWRPDENGIHSAHQLVDTLIKDIRTLKEDPNRFKALNPDNGWGSYEGLISFLENYLKACQDYPNAQVSVWR